MARNSGGEKPKLVHASDPAETSRSGAMERFHRDVAKLMEGRSFATIEEANAFLHEKMASGELNTKRDEPRWREDPIEQAQELCWQATEAPSLEQARRLYDKALALDPQCTDALVFRAMGAKSNEEAIEILEEAVLAAGERLGGKEYFRENKGHFWGMAETRPYMRSKAELAKSYCEAGRQLDGIAEYEHMLELCTNDNQGVRYPLLGRYLRAGELHRARKLLGEYEEASAVFLYGRMMVEVLEEEFAKAKRTLKKAIAENRHVYESLAGLREEELVGAGYYSPGDESEAAMVLECLEEAFVCNPAVTFWLVEQAHARGDQPAGADKLPRL